MARKKQSGFQRLVAEQRRAASRIARENQRRREKEEKRLAKITSKLRQDYSSLNRAAQRRIRDETTRLRRDLSERLRSEAKERRETFLAEARASRDEFRSLRSQFKAIFKKAAPREARKSQLEIKLLTEGHVTPVKIKAFTKTATIDQAKAGHKWIEEIIPARYGAYLTSLKRARSIGLFFGYAVIVLSAEGERNLFPSTYIEDTRSVEAFERRGFYFDREDDPEYEDEAEYFTSDNNTNEIYRSKSRRFKMHYIIKHETFQQYAPSLSEHRARQRQMRSERRRVKRLAAS